MTIGHVHIRQATLRDADLVRHITRTVYVGEGWATTPAYIRELLDVERRIVENTVLIADVVGTLTVIVPPHPSAHVAQPGEVEVRMLCVLPDARRIGVAQALMAAVEDLAYSRVVLSTEQQMKGAQKLYEGLGYRRTPERDWDIHGEKLLTYAKDVRPA
jgi:ribosomal protein S18 acetylase RimI-like enzyme